MDKRKKLLETWLFSTGGLVVLAVVLCLVNFIFDAANVRMDLTEEKLHTLSPGTKSILKTMDAPVKIRLFFSKDVTGMPVDLKTYADRVADLLKEYRRHSGGKITLERLNPEPDSDAEDAANMAGVIGQPLGAFGSGERIYFGVSVSCLDQTEALPFLTPAREDQLEYDLTRAVYRVLHPDSVKVGVMSGLPVMGQPQMNPMMQMQGMRPTPPWQVVSEFQRDLEVVEVAGDVESIDGDIDVLVLVHPKDLADKTLFALDQFVLGGGKLLAFLDPMSMVESQNRSPQMQFMPPGASTLGKLMESWGVEFDTEKVIADKVYLTEIRRRQGADPEQMPLVLSLTSSAVDKDDPAIGGLENLLFVFGGAFKVNPPEGLNKTVLLRTSPECQLVEKFMAESSADRILNEFKPEGIEMALAVRLAGTFKTAFPDGKPSAAEEPAEDGEAKPADTGEFLTRGSEGVVVLVGDSDMIYDHFCIQRGSIFGQTVVQAMNDNLNFAINLVEQLGGDTNLISIRSRGTNSRPFERVRKIQADAEKEYRDQITALEKELAEVESKISELQREKSPGDQLTLSADQMEAIRTFEQKKGETRQRLKEVRKSMRRDIASLENRIMFFNIGLMPILVTVGGIGLAVAKHRRMVRR